MTPVFARKLGLCLVIAFSGCAVAPEPAMTAAPTNGQSWICTFLSSPEGANIYGKASDGKWIWWGTTPFDIQVEASADPVQAKLGTNEILFNVPERKGVVRIDFTTTPPKVE